MIGLADEMETKTTALSLIIAAYTVEPIKAIGVNDEMGSRVSLNENAGKKKRIGVEVVPRKVHSNVMIEKNTGKQGTFWSMALFPTQGIVIALSSGENAKLT